jgi:hypothetical protein
VESAWFTELPLPSSASTISPSGATRNAPKRVFPDGDSSLCDLVASAQQAAVNLIGVDSGSNRPKAISRAA